MSHAPDLPFRKRIPRKWIFIGLFILLTLLSNLWRHFRPYAVPLAADQKTVSVAAYDIDGGAPVGTDDTTVVALRDIPGESPDAPTALMLHGAPGDSRELAPLVAALRGKLRLIVPDLPGSGASSGDIPDFSAACAAKTMLDTLDRLGVKRAHVIGCGMGGAVALEMTRLAPERVASLELLSAVGSQEFDLLGNHIVNHIVYTFQMGGVKFIKDFLPHFGLLDGMAINKAYARTLWDTDLSNLKSATHDWRGPLLLAHGESDWAVTPDTARYAAQLAPQAEKLFVPGSHDVFLKNAGEHAPRIADFITRADAGKAPVRDASAPAGEIPKPPRAEGLRHLSLLAIIFLCTLVAEDPTCLATGLLVAQGLIDFWSGTAACLVGIFTGDFFLYLVGFVLGRPALTKAPLKWLISEYAVDRMSAKFGSTKGMAFIVTSRFIPGSRVPTFLTAGIMRLNPAKLGFLFFVAAALWTPPLILLGQYTGGSVIEKFEHYHHLAGWIAAGVLIAIFILFHYVVPSFTWRGRRELLAKAKRKKRGAGPENIFHALKTWIRNGGPAACVNANPGFGRLGGAEGESKNQLLSFFTGDDAVVPFEKIQAKNADAAIAFAEKHGFPVVLKPDGAENGISVRIARDAEAIRRWFAAFGEEALIQPYAPGGEYEVVWARTPEAHSGKILSVVEKSRLTITGDGRHTLEHLVLANDEALPDAELFVRINAGREDSIPADGETLFLCEIGSVAKGARATLRPELAGAAGAGTRLNALLSTHPEIHWLRLDIRADSDAAFSAGENWRITEIEGAGKFASVKNDASLSILERGRILSEQRETCFAIAHANRLKTPGSPFPSLLDFIATRSEARETKDINPH